jgi:hypothetical protein
VSSSHAGRWCRRAAGSLAILAAVSVPVPAHAADVPGTGPFGLTPTPTSAGQPRPYFNLSVAPGRSAWDTAIISNGGTGTERLRVTISQGVTAANSGSAFEGMAGRCAGAACWVTGLPATVTLAPGAREVLAFRIAVPPGTRPAQYLTGITAESAIQPRAVRLGSNGHSSAKAIIIDQITVGIAVTVGSRSRLRTALAIPAVSAGWVGPTPRLYILVRNTGQTFGRATGNVSCRDHSYRVIVDTVLPGGSAVLPVNAPGLSSGLVPCAVHLRDGAGPPVTWSGIVNVPGQARTIIFHPEAGVYTSVPADTIPPWAVALLVIGTLILASLVTLLVLRRRHRGRRPADTESIVIRS